jgi:hypothetical protein
LELFAALQPRICSGIQNAASTCNGAGKTGLTTDLGFPYFCLQEIANVPENFTQVRFGGDPAFGTLNQKDSRSRSHAIRSARTAQ